MLHVQDLHAYYGKSHVLQGVNFEVGTRRDRGRCLGRNGSGRSTTAKAIMGLVHCAGRACDWLGHATCIGRKPFDIAHLGLGYVPENRDIFPKLTVHQNLLLGLKARQTPLGAGILRSMYTLFSAFARAPAHRGRGACPVANSRC
jgi:branched-chain amino acid transport system ATP-binding protein